MINRTSYAEPETYMQRRIEEPSSFRPSTGTNLLLLLGVGLVTGLIIRALRPEPTPQRRLVRMMEDLEDRLHDMSAPVVRKASSLASDGAQALSDGIHRGEADLQKVVRNASRRLSGLRLSSFFK